jgi:hypothetical protein
MGKFKVTFRLEKLELEVEGSRDDMPLVADQVGRQVAGLFQPAAQLVAGEPADRVGVGAQPVIVPASSDGKRKPTKRRKSTATASASVGAEGAVAPLADVVLNWRHDTAKWGTPKKDWSLSNKILYLLYVAKAEADQRDLTASTIVETFNRLFKQSGPLETRYVTRELGRMKSRTNAPVSEDATQTPSFWFLNPNGDTEARRLVAGARGESSNGVPDRDAVVTDGVSV